MKITIVRHGETDYNKNNILQGRSNISLNDAGRRQCKRLKYKLKDEKFDICFSSPLVRAVETAMILVGDRVEIKIDDRLIERNLGNYEGKEVTGYDSIKHWDYNLNLNDNGIEPIKDIIKRVDDFVTYLKNNYMDKDILIVTHGGIVRALYHILNNTDLNSKLYHFNIDNCYIKTIEIK